MILGGILLGLIILIYLFQSPWQDWGKGPNFLSDLEIDQVEKIEVTREDSTSVLIREGEFSWRVEGEGDFYLTESDARELEEKMSDLAKAEFELASGEEEKKEEFDTNKEQGSWVKVYKEGELFAEFVVGQMDSHTFGNTYISHPDKPETYSVLNLRLTSLFLKDDWRSRIIFDTPKEEIDRLRFQYPDREFALERGTTTDEEGEEVKVWQGVSPSEFAVDQEKLEEVLEVMTDLRAFDIPEQDFEGTGLTDHLIIVEASGDDVSNILMVGESHDTDYMIQEEREMLPEEMSEEEVEEYLADMEFPELYYAKRGDSDSIYLILGEERDLLDQTIQSLN